MKARAIKRIVKLNPKSNQWKIQQLFGELVVQLDRLPDANEVSRNPLKSAPTELTEMVF